MLVSSFNPRAHDLWFRVTTNARERTSSLSKNPMRPSGNHKFSQCTELRNPVGTQYIDLSFLQTKTKLETKSSQLDSSDNNYHGKYQSQQEGSQCSCIEEKQLLQL